jgi:hypothetical protein
MIILIIVIKFQVAFMNYKEKYNFDLFLAWIHKWARELLDRYIVETSGHVPSYGIKLILPLLL